MQQPIKGWFHGASCEQESHEYAGGDSLYYSEMVARSIVTTTVREGGTAVAAKGRRAL